MRGMTTKRQTGFTLVELVTVVAIMLIVAAVSVPNILNFMHMAKLRGSASDYSSLLQVSRIRSVQDDTFYSTYILPGATGNPGQAYVDLKKNGGTKIDAGDPEIETSSEVTAQAVGNAPDTANLSGQFLPTGSGVTPQDASVAPVIFSPRGLPCTTQLAGAVCTSAAGPTAFWAFFQDSSSSAWEAVTVSPAGRVQKWQHAGSAWSKL
jgi:prepilin-type N-terminal cleavage/methylation domain-containing protein